MVKAMMHGRMSKTAAAFVDAAGSLPLLLEVTACAIEYDRPKAVNVIGGITVVDVSGLLTEDHGWWGSTYQEIRSSIQAALDDDQCRAILLRINSPGGETNQAFETAAFIADASKKKPIWAVADVSCYSAAYLLASQCSKVVASPKTGGIGSIGVYGAHADYSKALDKAGIQVTLISAGKGKTNGNPYEPLSEEARDVFQAEVDRLYDMFVAAVARGRGLSEKAVLDMGAVLQHGGKNAIASGLADAAATFEETLGQMISSVSTAAASAAAKMKGVSMEEEKSAGVEATASGGVLSAGMQAAQEIAEMCEMAGIPAKTAEMLAFAAGGAPMADVRRKILDAKASVSSEEIRVSAASVPSGKSKSGLLAAAVDQQAALFRAHAQASMQGGN